MSMTEDWKGEHLIRGVKPTRLERQSTNSKVATGLSVRRAQTRSEGPALTRGGLRGVISAACAEALSGARHPGKET